MLCLVALTFPDNAYRVVPHPNLNRMLSSDDPNDGDEQGTYDGAACQLLGDGPSKASHTDTPAPKTTRAA